MKERILVTGGTGYIGSHTVVELQNAGYEVVIIDNLSNSNADVVDNIEKVSGIRPAFEKLDCLDYAGLDAMFEKYKGIKAIIHFAASKAVGESVQKPLMYYRNNLGSLINLLELMPKHGVEGIVFSSSCTVYGQPDPENLPVTEKAPIKKAESPYGNTKQINEEIIQDTVASGAPINAILLRYFNPIGAHPTALLGELPNGVPQNLIPYLTQTAIGIREKLTVFGDDYSTPDGSCIRAGRFLHPRLHQRGRPGQGSRSGHRPHPEQEAESQSGSIQRRYRSRTFRIGADQRFRGFYRCEVELSDWTPSCRRHRASMGRPHFGQYRVGLESGNKH